MRLQLLGLVGVAREIGAVGVAVAEQHVHDGAGERAVRAGLQTQRQIRLPHRLGVVDVDDDDLRAALLSRAHRVGHHVDLRRDRVGAPDDDAVGLGHFARIDAGDAPGAGEIAGPGDGDADRAEEARIALDVRQPLDPVAHHEAHRARVEIRPDAFGAEAALGLQEFLRDDVERVVPGDRLELTGALRADAAQRLGQPVLVMDALGIARDLGADDARRCSAGPRAPWMRPIRAPPITSTSSAQTDGQSCGQTEGRRTTSRGAFMGENSFAPTVQKPRRNPQERVSIASTRRSPTPLAEGVESRTRAITLDAPSSSALACRVPLRSARPRLSGKLGQSSGRIALVALAESVGGRRADARSRCALRVEDRADAPAPGRLRRTSADRRRGCSRRGP